MENKRRLLVLLLLFLLSSIGMFGQNKIQKQNEVVLDKNQTEIVNGTEVNAIASLDSQIDFVNWFMGSKQSQMMNESSASGNNSSTTTKRQILSSGVVPNRVLYKTFVKKVINKDNALV